MSDPFWNEHPQPTPDNPWGGSGGSSSGGSSSGGGGWGSGSGSGSGTGSGSGGGDSGTGSPGTGSGSSFPMDPEEIWHPLAGDFFSNTPVILTDGTGLILTDGAGRILTGVDGCIKIKVECQIQGTDSAEHIRCIILRTILQTGEKDGFNTVMEQLTRTGRITLGACWQEGHYNHEILHTVRFRINKNVTPWIYLPLNPEMQFVAELIWTGQEIKIETIRSL